MVVMVETHRGLALGTVGGRTLWGLAAIAVAAGTAGGCGGHDHCVQVHCHRWKKKTSKLLKKPVCSESRACVCVHRAAYQNNSLLKYNHDDEFCYVLFLLMGIIHECKNKESYS